jgi:hypothetical protein
MKAAAGPSESFVKGHGKTSLCDDSMMLLLRFVWTSREEAPLLPVLLVEKRGGPPFASVLVEMISEGGADCGPSEGPVESKKKRCFVMDLKRRLIDFVKGMEDKTALRVFRWSLSPKEEQC